MLEKGTERPALPHSNPASAACLPNPTHSAALLHDLRGHSADVLCHQQSGAQLATGAADCSARLWDLRSGRAQHAVPLGSFPYSIQAGGACCAARAGGRDRAWPALPASLSARASSAVLSALAHCSAPGCLQMDDRRLAVGCSNGAVQVVDLRGGAGPQGAQLQAHTVLPMHRERVRRACEAAAAACARRWAARLRRTELLALHVHSARPSSAICPPPVLLPVQVWALALDGPRLISASLDAAIVVRSFRPADVAHQGGWLDSCGDLQGSASEADSDDELEPGSDGSGSEWESDAESEADEDEEEGGGGAAEGAAVA